MDNSMWIKEFAGKLMATDQHRIFVFDVIEDGESVNIQFIHTLRLAIEGQETFFKSVDWIQCPISDRMIAITDTASTNDDERGSHLTFWSITSDFKVSLLS